MKENDLWTVENILYDVTMDILNERYHGKTMTAARISEFATVLDIAFNEARKQYPMKKKKKAV
jgi:hypothetical protein